MAGIALGLIGSFPTPVTSSYESIATVTVATPTGTVTINSIPSSYTHLQLRIISKVDGSGGGYWDCLVRANGDTGSNYAFHYLSGNGSTASAFGQSSRTSMQLIGANYENTGNVFGASVLDIHDYASTTKNKTFRVFSGVNTNAGSTLDQVHLRSGLWMSTTAINSISILGNGQNFTAGSVFSLYGIKGA
jgi:hypothetical protein